MMRSTTTKSNESCEWKRYRATGEVEVRNRLVERHVPLVYHFAHRLQSRAVGILEVEDLVSAGLEGLMAAVASFDPERGFRFSTYAAPRIRGAMLDELRRRDPAPRSVRRRQREMERATERLAEALDRRPHHGEVARVLGVDAKTLWRWKWDVARSRSVSLTDVLTPGGGGAGAVPEPVAAGPELVEDRLTLDAELRRLRRELTLLSERERLVIEWYDMESLTLREIGERLGITESRVSQIRTRVLARLRDRMKDLREAA